MTIPQIQGFLKAITKRSMAQRAAMLADTAIASQSDGKSVQKAIKSYEDARRKLSETEK